MFSLLIVLISQAWFFQPTIAISQLQPANVQVQGGSAPLQGSVVSVQNSFQTVTSSAVISFGQPVQLPEIEVSHAGN